MPEDTLAAVLDCVQRDTNLPLPADVGPETPLGPEGLGIESLAMLELLLSLERRFGISLPDDELEDAGQSTVADLVAMVDRHRAAISAPTGADAT